MLSRTIGLLLVAWGGVLFFACSTSPGTSTSSTTGTTGTGGAPSCDGLIFAIGDDAADPCNACVIEKCCAELAACRSEHCRECADYGGDPCCGTPCGDTKSPWNVLRTCAGTICQPHCFPSCFPGFCPDAGDDG
jgi:hypothetical protein